MRSGVVLCLMLMACSKEPTFDEQFKKQSAEIQAKADKIERDLKEQIELVPEAKEAEAPVDKADQKTK